MENKKTGTVEVIFENEEKINVTDLSGFLYYLKAVHSLVLSIKAPEYREFSLDKLQEAIKNREGFLQEFNKVVFENDKKINLSNLFKKGSSEDDVFIEKIRKESPLEIWFIASTSALVLAFILAGGQIEITIVPPKIKVKMSSLGKAVKEFKNAVKK